MRANTFTCLDCGHEFDEPIQYEEHHGLDDAPYEKWNACPYCGGPYAPTHICEYCGKAITGWYVRIKDGTEYCDNCLTTYELGDEADWLI